MIALLTTARRSLAPWAAPGSGWMAQQGNWRGAFFILGVVGLLYAAPIYLFLRKVDENTQVETRPAGAGLAIASLVRAPTYLMLCTVFPLFLFGLWLIYSWLPNSAREIQPQSLRGGLDGHRLPAGGDPRGHVPSGGFAPGPDVTRAAPRLWAAGSRHAGLLRALPARGTDADRHLSGRRGVRAVQRFPRSATSFLLRSRSCRPTRAPRPSGC